MSSEPIQLDPGHTGCMLSQLRTPLFFCLLTVVVAGWASAWTLPNDNYYSPFVAASERNMHRPVYSLANRIAGRSPVLTMTTRCGTYVDKETCFIETPSGSRVATLIIPLNGKYPDSYEGETILAAGKPDRTHTMHEFGLLAPVAFRVSTKTNLVRVAHYPMIDPALAAGVNTENALTKLDYPYPVPIDHNWTIKPRAAVHDTLFLLTLLSWLVSLAAIPKWPLWRRLTPAQRRRTRGCCPHCDYNLEGLTAPTCPECGNTIERFAVS